MDEKLRVKLSDIKNNILEHIFNNNNKLIEKWNNDNIIDLNKETFEVLFHGDWSRNSKCKLNLDKFLDTSNKPSVIFNEIKKELQRPKTEGLYKSNFNPNLFFLFFEEFYDLQLKNTSEKSYKLSYDFIRRLNDGKIIGIKIKNREQLENNYVLRKEIIHIIEFHSKILFDELLRDYLGDEIFGKIFIKNCIIQKKVLTYNDIRFIDLCYALDKVILYPTLENEQLSLEDLQKIESKNLYLEVNEEKHIPMLDKLRNNSLVATSGIRICHIETVDVANYYHNDIYKNLIKIFCKIAFNQSTNKDSYLFNMKNIIMRIYLSIIEELNSQFVDFIVSYRYENKNYSINDIFELINQNNDSNEPIKKKQIIKKLFKNKFFEDNEIYSNLTIYDEINEDVEYIIKNISNINLTRYGIESLFYSIESKYWTNKGEFIKFKIDVEKKYLDSIESMLKDDTIDILVDEHNVKNAIFYILKNYNKIDFDKLKNNVNTKKAFLKYKNKLHPELPFLIRSEKSTVDYRTLGYLMTDEMVEKYKYENDIYNNLIIGYRPLFETEIKEILGIYDDYEF